MIILARAVCAAFLIILVSFILIWPYRNQLRFSYPVTFLCILACSILFTIPYSFVGYIAYVLGPVRLLASCAITFLHACILSYLTKSAFPVMVFSAFFVRNMTDSLMMAARFIQIFLIPGPPMADYATLILYIVFYLAITPYLIHFAEKDIRPNVIYLAAKTRKLLWMIPFTFYLFFRLFADAEYMQEIAVWTPRSIILPFVWFFGTMICHYILLTMIRETAQTTELTEQLKYSDMMIKVQRREYTALESNIKVTREIRHDMRHHLIALDGYLNEPDIPAARSYLSSLIDSIDSVRLKPYCPNYAVNSLLNYYADKAEENHIKVTISVNLSDHLPIADTDFCSILGNLFENSLEACLRPNVTAPFISLNVGYAGRDMLILSVRNSYAGVIRVSGGNFISSKRNEIGLGTASVKYMTEKYNGVCRFSYQNNIFEVSILLNPSLSAREEGAVSV